MRGLFKMLLILLLTFMSYGISCARVVTGDTYHIPTESTGTSWYWYAGIAIAGYLLGHLGISKIIAFFKIFFR